METVKKTKKYTIVKKKNGRYGVMNPKKKWINGPEKVEILVTEGLITVSKAAEKPVEEDQSAEGTSAAEEVQATE